MRNYDPAKDFGILPAGQSAPQGKIRSEMRTRTVIGQWIATLMFDGTFAVAGVVLLFAAVLVRMDLSNRGVCAGLGLFALCGAAFMTSLNLDDNVWVELDGDTIRAKRLYSRKIIERPVADINDVLTQVMQLRTVSVKVVEHFQGRIRGFAIRFHDMPKGIKLVQPEMTNVPQLISAVFAAMGRHGELAPEITEFAGRPLVRRVTWARQLQNRQQP